MSPRGIATLLPLLIMSIGLAGCATGPLSALSTGASMRVEVEVYKGPLSKPLSLQVAELGGLVEEAEQALDHFGSGATRTVRDDCENGPMRDPVGCNHLRKIVSDACDMLREAQRILGTHEKDIYSGDVKKLKKAAAATSNFASQLNAKAFFWAQTQISAPPVSHGLRAIMADFTTLASEMSNQIAARSSVLYKQLAAKSQPGDIDRLDRTGKALAISDHLRDASPPVFLHLYDWYEATRDPYGSRWSTLDWQDAQLPLADSTGRRPIKLLPDDRVKVAQALFADHYWTKINEVHASGQGEVRMAFVKDDIGNWDLKSFDNDPTELLDAYRELSLAGVKAATDLAGKLAKGAAPGAAVIGYANDFSLGRVGARQASLASAQRIASLRQGLIDDLQALHDTAKGKMADLEQRTAAAKKRADDTSQAAQTQRDLYQQALQQRNRTASAVAELSTTVVARGNRLEQTRRRITELEAIEAGGGTLSNTQSLELAQLRTAETSQAAELAELNTQHQEMSATLESRQRGLGESATRLVEANQIADADRSAYGVSQQSQQAYTAMVTAQARTILNLHRRVLDTLKNTSVD